VEIGGQKEAATHREQAAATLLWDVVKAYENIEYNHLIDEAVAVKLPLTILRLNIAAYSVEKFIMTNCMVQRGARASRAIGAGCGAATTLIKVHYLRPFGNVMKKIPGLRLKVFVDDVQLDQEDDESIILECFPRAARLVQQVLLDALKASIEENKAALVATSETLATALRKELGAVAGKHTEVANNLGIGTTAGRARRTRANTTMRRLRIIKAGRAAYRLLKLRTVAPMKV